MLQFMWLGLGRLQDGERWELTLEGNVRMGAETPSGDEARPRSGCWGLIPAPPPRASA